MIIKFHTVIQYTFSIKTCKLDNWYIKKFQSTKDKNIILHYIQLEESRGLMNLLGKNRT